MEILVFPSFFFFQLIENEDLKTGHLSREVSMGNDHMHFSLPGVVTGDSTWPAGVREHLNVTNMAGKK